MWTETEMSAAREQLKTLIAANNIMALDHAIKGLGLDFILSNTFIDYCRLGRESNMVIFLNTLVEHNTENPIPTPKIKLVVATKLTEADFFQKSATGKSIELHKFPHEGLCLFPNNSVGLSKIYNSVIDDSANDPCILIFMHDDLHIIDYHWINHVITGLEQFKILGLAGNRRRAQKQPSWFFIEAQDAFVRDYPQNLSGVIGHPEFDTKSRFPGFLPPRP
jgi:hypothetical protein